MTKFVILLKNKTIPDDPYELKFEKEGYSTKFIPLLKHSHSDKDATKKYLCSEEFMQTPIFIITSQRAVEILNECISELQDEAIKQRIFTKIGYTVGPATDQALKDAGFHNIRGGKRAGNGSILSNIIIDEIQNDQKIVFITGEIRKDIIPRKLKDNGFQLSERVIYKTKPRTDIINNFKREWENAPQNPWLVFFSPQGTEEIVSHIVNTGATVKIASIGPTTKEYLDKKSLTPHIVSKKPEAGSLYESVFDFDG
ncbi:uncharacterized protein PRCAT00002323001 [Priceomyces carsonii]|uniref:uncharacterized protein n=1 Tax=Priceomyces carsonii TaxID=28549 RepID=UPI002ED99289|nr:unnamed protein product [Priceomyces carsonii]